MAHDLDVLFLRHANAQKAQTEGFEADLARILSERGIGQANLRRQERGYPSFTRVFASPATRTMATAQLVAGSGWTLDIMALHELAPTDPREGGDAARIDELFNGLGYSPLRSYRGADRGVMDRYARQAGAELRDSLTGTGEEQVLIVGHAVLSTAAFLGAYGDSLSQSMKATLLNLHMDEAHGFSAKIRNGRVKSLGVLPRL